MQKQLFQHSKKECGIDQCFPNTVGLLVERWLVAPRDEWLMWGMKGRAIMGGRQADWGGHKADMEGGGRVDPI